MKPIEYVTMKPGWIYIVDHRGGMSEGVFLCSFGGNTMWRGLPFASSEPMPRFIRKTDIAGVSEVMRFTHSTTEEMYFEELAKIL